MSVGTDLRDANENRAMRFAHLRSGQQFDAIDWSATETVSTDVFDTLLLRRPLSQPRRYALIAVAAAVRLDHLGIRVPSDFLTWARSQAERAAFRWSEMRDNPGEVRLRDVIERQIELLGIQPDDALIELFESAELDVEKTCVVANTALVEALRALRLRGIRTVAITDTIWSSRLVKELIESTIPDPPLDEIFASSDYGATKRHGSLFGVVSSNFGYHLSRSYHIGDHPHSDIAKALACGVGGTIHLPRTPTFVARRKADAALYKARAFIKSRRQGDSARPKQDHADFYRRIVGPIVADFCVRLWLNLRTLETDGETVALFCARGGLTLRVAFERFLERTGLPLEAARHDLMISRLIAARGAILAGGDAVYAELEREFRGDSCADVARALSGLQEAPPSDWDKPFEKERFKTLLATGDGRTYLDALKVQSELFEVHLKSLLGCSRHPVLVDTGLYGSTLRLMREAFPTHDFKSILIARCNYKQLPDDHFKYTVGLLVERDYYSAFDKPSAILRYWHFIEDLFEPKLTSVARFEQSPTGLPRSNLESDGWQDVVAQKPEFAACLSYLDGLSPEDVACIPDAAAAAWRRLHNVLVFPSPMEAGLLTTGERGRDFGRSETIETGLSEIPAGLRDRLRASLKARWKEGAVAQSMPRARSVIQAGLETAYIMRSLVNQRSRLK